MDSTDPARLYRGYIAIDDMDLQPGTSCIGFCNFAGGFCDWANDAEDDFDWTIVSLSIVLILYYTGIVLYNCNWTIASLSTVLNYTILVYYTGIVYIIYSIMYTNTIVRLSTVLILYYTGIVYIIYSITYTNTCTEPRKWESYNRASNG